MPTQMTLDEKTEIALIPSCDLMDSKVLPPCGAGYNCLASLRALAVVGWGCFRTQLGIRAIELEKAGKLEEGSKLIRSIPLPPYLAKLAKEALGSQGLIESGFNLSEAEYGKDWLDR